jgi:hypothetical protein
VMAELGNEFAAEEIDRSKLKDTVAKDRSHVAGSAMFSEAHNLTGPYR